ncbi:MAG: nucleoside triphosphate pyrophosphohydrolase [Chloroflexi bacterium]|nr:nucleoside triphosphate pyrophosphohydrolase [Chloroflexota bacterium]
MALLSHGRLLDAALATFRLEALTGVQLWEVAALLAAARPAGLPAPGAPVTVASYAETQGFGAYQPPPAPFPLAPVAPAVIHGEPTADWPALAALLQTRYPAAHPVQCAAVDPAGATGAPRADTLAEIAAWPLEPAGVLLLYVPPLAPAADGRGADGLRWVVTRLLAPGGCPWDVRQTHRSLRAALLEETHEVLEAIDADDLAALSEELGDLLIAVFSHSEMARQAGHFALEDVLEQVTRKLIGRHPHVFAELAVEGESQVLRNWEQIKAAELAARGKSRASALDGVPPTLPALAAAQKLGKKAARAGFNWADVAQVWAKLQEELDELAVAAAAGDPRHAAEELGDALFVATRLADWLGLDAEAALREANAKFRRRFTALEAAAAARGRPLAAMELDELLALWDEAKRV